MSRDHDPIVLKDIRGLFDRGEEESVPRGYFLTSQNNKFLKNGVKTREGSSKIHTISSVKRQAIYKRTGEAQRLLLLDGAGNIFDSTNLAAPILTIVGMTDFSAQTIFNRAYITPHNGVTGLPGEVVYVYNGSGTARAAAGAAPTGFTLTLADSATSGHVETGIHLVGVAFETDSGYLTAPGGFQFLNSVGGKKLNVDLLPIGPATTAARVLVATKAMTIFNGDFLHQTYYFIPNGRVAGNVATNILDTLSFYDADLEDDASYLLDQIGTIPAGVGIGLYNARMIVWGENANQSIVRVSVSAEPESFDAGVGFLTVNPGDSGNGVKNCWEFRKQLICQKSKRSYVTKDNDNDAAFWPVDKFDDSIGTEPHGVAKIMDFGEVIEDKVLIGSPNGLQVFDGTFSQTPLTYSIDDIWARITKLYFHTIEICINPYDYEVFVAVPLDGATSPNYVLYGDFTEGLSADKIKWDLWKFPNPATTVVVDLDSINKEASFRYGCAAGNVFKLDTSVLNDNGTAIDSWVEFSLLPDDAPDVTRHFTGIGVRVKGSGTLLGTYKGLDGVGAASLENTTLVTAPGYTTFVGMNFQNERCSVKLRVNGGTDYYIITKFTIYGLNLWIR